MRFSYVLPDPSTYRDWNEFEGDLACMRQVGYDAVELQIADPAIFDEDRVGHSLQRAGFALCAFQTGSTYYSRGNCLCTADETVRRRTIALLKSFVELAARSSALIVFGSLQGRHSDEPDHAAGAARILAAMQDVGQYASEKNVTVAFEPVNHGEVGFHNTIAEVAEIVHSLDLPGLQMMVDTFHMNIEEQDMLAPLAGIRDILAHVHLSETNRDVLGAGHWPTAAFLDELARIGYRGYCTVGVYNTRRPRRECLAQCMKKMDAVRTSGS